MKFFSDVGYMEMESYILQELSIKDLYFPRLYCGKIKQSIVAGTWNISEEIPENFVRSSVRVGGVGYHDEGHIIFAISLKVFDKKLFSDIFYTIQTCINESLNQLGIESYTTKDHPGIYLKRKQLCPITFGENVNGKVICASLNFSGDLENHNSGLNLCNVSYLVATSIEKEYGNLFERTVVEETVRNNLIISLNKKYGFIIE
jgi:lipoate-protein ligase B